MLSSLSRVERLSRFIVPSTDQTPAEPIDSLYVITWNVHVGGGDLRRLVADLRAGELTGGRPVDSYVLLLQEVHRAGPEVPATATPDARASGIASVPPSGERHDVVEAARSLGLHVLYVPSMRNGEGGAGVTEDRGNAILTPLAIEAPEAIELPLVRQRRVAVAATVRGVTSKGESWSLRLVNAHLENRAPWSRALDSFGAGRRDWRGRGRGGGDMNTFGPGFLESALGIFRKRFPDGPRQDEPTMTVMGVPRPIDHLFFGLPEGWEASLERVDDRYGSDHHPEAQEQRDDSSAARGVGG